MKLGIGIIGPLGQEERMTIEEIWNLIQEGQQNPKNSLWLIELGGDEAFSEKLKEFLNAARFKLETGKVLLQLKEIYEPLTKFSLETVIPKQLICDGSGNLDIGLTKYYFQVAVKLFP